MLLTIGIPTYNRAEYLDKLLNKIVPICDRKSIYILVSDNCSTDKTSKVIDKYIKYNNFRFIRNSSNIGFDRNILALFQNVDSHFLWLFGDDDDIDIAKIDDILSLLKSNSNAGLFYLGYRQDCDAAKKTTSINGIDYQIIDAQEYSDRFLARATLISTNIINMGIYNTISLNNDCLSKEWFQVHVLLSIVEKIKKNKGVAIAVNDEIIIQKTANDEYSFKFWAEIFVDYIIYTLDNTIHEGIRLDKFKNVFYRINIRRHYLRKISNIGLKDALSISRKIILNYNPPLIDRLLFWLILILFKFVSKDRLRRILLLRSKKL